MQILGINNTTYASSPFRELAFFMRKFTPCLIPFKERKRRDEK